MSFECSNCNTTLVLYTYIPYALSSRDVNGKKNKYWNDKRAARHSAVVLVLLICQCRPLNPFRIKWSRGEEMCTYIYIRIRLGYVALSCAAYVNRERNGAKRKKTNVKINEKKIARCARQDRKWFSKGLCKHTLLCWIYTHICIEEATSRGVPRQQNSSHSLCRNLRRLIVRALFGNLIKQLIIRGGRTSSLYIRLYSSPSRIFAFFYV